MHILLKETRKWPRASETQVCLKCQFGHFCTIRRTNIIYMHDNLGHPPKEIRNPGANKTADGVCQVGETKKKKHEKTTKTQVLAVG